MAEEEAEKSDEQEAEAKHEAKLKAQEEAAEAKRNFGAFCQGMIEL